MRRCWRREEVQESQGFKGPGVPRSQGPKDQDISNSHSTTSLTLKKVHFVCLYFYCVLDLIFLLYFCKYLNSRKDPADDKIIESDVANPFKMLSAYFIVAAINRPPPKSNKRVMLKSHEKLRLMIIDDS